MLARNDETKESSFLRVDTTSGAYTQEFKGARLLGSSGTIANDGESFNNVELSADGSVLAYIAEDVQHPAEVWSVDRHFKHPKRLTNLNPELTRYRFGSSQVLGWLDANGRVVRGALLLPPGYDAKRRYPLIVTMYPGAEWSNIAHFFGMSISRSPVDDFHLYSTRGYAVLVADTIQDSMVMMRSIAESIWPGINKTIEMGIADPERLRVTGISGAGYATAALVVQSPRFAAAVIRAPGNLDLFSMAGRMDANGGSAYQFLSEGQLGATIWSGRERYLENSPLFYADRIQSPILLIQGTDDTGIVQQADELFVGLKRLGKTAQYVKYEGEWHGQGAWRYENQLDYLERSLGWFGQHMRADQ